MIDQNRGGELDTERAIKANEIRDIYIVYMYIYIIYIILSRSPSPSLGCIFLSLRAAINLTT